MAKNIWTGKTTSTGDWLLFSNNKTTMTGDGSTDKIVFIIKEATDVDDEKTGTVTIYANGETIVKTITRCVPEVTRYWYSNLYAVISGETQNTVSPCKVTNPCAWACDNGIIITNITMDKTTEISEGEPIIKTGIPVSLNDVNIRYTIDEREYTYLPENYDNDREVTMKLIHKTAKDENGVPLSYEYVFTQYGFKGSHGGNYIKDTGYTTQDILVINSVTITNDCNPTCEEGTCVFSEVISASIFSGSKTGRTVCGDIITIEPGTETPIEVLPPYSEDWRIIYNAIPDSSNVSAYFDGNQLHYSSNKSILNNANIDVYAYVENTDYETFMTSNGVKVTIPPGCGESFSLVLSASTTSISYSQNYVTIEWYYKYNESGEILTVDSDGMDARNCTTGVTFNPSGELFATFGPISHNSNGISSVVATFSNNQTSNNRSITFQVSDNDGRSSSVTIYQSSIGLHICFGPTPISISYTGASVAIDYYLATGNTCDNRSSMFNMWTGLTLNCSTADGNHCPSFTYKQALTNSYRQTCSFPVNSSNEQITYTLSASCPGISDSKTVSIAQEGMPIFNVKLDIKVGYEPVIPSSGGKIVLEWYVYTGATASKINALDNDFIKSEFWPYSLCTVRINNDNIIHWSELTEGCGVVLGDDSGYSNGVFWQEFRFLENGLIEDKRFLFTVGNRKAYNISSNVEVIQRYMSYIIHTYKDYYNGVKYDGTRLDGGTTVKIYYYLSESHGGTETKVTDENILFDENHNSYLDLSVPQNGVNVVDTGYSEGVFYKEVSFGENYGENGIIHEFTATCEHYGCEPQIETVYQGSRYENIIPNCDYFVFSYSWENTDGTDLDSFTVLSVYDTYSETEKHMKSFKDEYNYNKETSGLTVGFGGSAASRYLTSSTLVNPETLVPLTAQTYYVGDINNPYLKHGCDNTRSGAEGAVINIKQILKSNQIADDDTIVIDIYGNWFDSKNVGNCRISYKQISGLTETGNYQTEIVETEHENYEGSEQFYYSFSNAPGSSIEIDSKITDNIYVFAQGSYNFSKSNRNNSGCPIKSFYSKLATLTFNNKTNTTNFFFGNGLPDYSESGYDESAFKIITYAVFDNVTYDNINPLPSTVMLPATGGTFVVDNIYYKIKYGETIEERHLFDNEAICDDYIKIDEYNKIRSENIGETISIASNDRGIYEAKLEKNVNSQTYKLTFKMKSYQEVFSEFGKIVSLDFYIDTINPFVKGCGFCGRLGSLMRFKLSNS